MRKEWLALGCSSPVAGQSDNVGADAGNSARQRFREGRVPEQ